MENRKSFTFRLPPNLVARVDRVRGHLDRTAFVEQALVAKLAAYERMGRFGCPAPGCEYSTDHPGDECPDHGLGVELASLDAVREAGRQHGFDV
jgi:hypothetical protein